MADKKDLVSGLVGKVKEEAKKSVPAVVDAAANELKSELSDYLKKRYKASNNADERAKLQKWLSFLSS